MMVIIPAGDHPLWVRRAREVERAVISHCRSIACAVLMCSLEDCGLTSLPVPENGICVCVDRVTERSRVVRRAIDGGRADAAPSDDRSKAGDSLKLASRPHA